MEKR
ncbi:hypothetical protein D037_2419A, partial [Vibrio parahaemolyticus IDH02640]|jgi:hypothetical protein